MPAKHRVRLSPDERARLERLLRAGTHHARTIHHARILLAADEADGGPAWTDEHIADALACGVATVERVRRRYLADGLDAALRPIQPLPGRPPKIDGVAEAHLVALACSEPPVGRARWTIRLLADRYVALGVEEGWLPEPVSRETVRLALKKTRCAPTA